MNTSCFLKLMVRSVMLVVISITVITCAPQEPSPPVITTLTSPSDYDRLFNEYMGQVEARRNEISVMIEPTKVEYSSTELIELEVTITNLSDHHIVIRRPEAELNYLVFPTPMEFMLIPSDPDIRINLLLPLGHIDDRIEIRPDEFFVLEKGKSYTGIVPLIPRPEPPLPVGSYSVKGTYQNYDFGAFSIDKEILISDYNAWMGEVETNTTTLEVIP